MKKIEPVEAKIISLEPKTEYLTPESGKFYMGDSPDGWRVIAILGSVQTLAFGEKYIIEELQENHTYGHGIVELSSVQLPVDSWVEIGMEEFVSRLNESRTALEKGAEDEAGS